MLVWAILSFVAALIMAVVAGYVWARDDGLSGSIIGIMVLLLAGISVAFFYHVSIGKPASLHHLDEEIIYRLDGQVQTVNDKTILVLENGKGDVVCIEVSNPTPKGTYYLCKKAAAEGRWKLVPLTEKGVPAEKPEEKSGS